VICYALEKIVSLCPLPLDSFSQRFTALWLEEELWMSVSTWGESDSFAEETYPVTLLTALLKQMMLRFGAQGACIALHDETIGQMKVQVHIRLKNASTSPAAPDPLVVADAAGRVTAQLDLDDDETQRIAALVGKNRTRPLVSSTDDIEYVTAEQSELFAVGTAYPLGQDLIGYAWQKNEPYAMRHEDYTTLMHAAQPLALHADVIPSHYLVVPVRESTFVDEMRGHKRSASVLGVVVLYYIGMTSPLLQQHLQQQRGDALQYTERIAIYLQNDTLRRKQRRTSEYLQLLQTISSAFPTSVKLSDLVEQIYRFVTRVVDVSGMLLTIYDRDLDRLYDIFAIVDGMRVEGLGEKPAVRTKNERPVWWHVTQQEKDTLLFSPAQDREQRQKYQELLTGVWGDQCGAESFLLLPMKMFHRVIGAICISSLRPHAYQLEEIQVLEAMTQIVTVSIENTKLYERDRAILHEARQREGQLAAINSALQAISSVLNTTELLNNLVESVALITKVDLCVFFEPSKTHDVLKAYALYAPSSVQMVDDGSGMPTITPRNRGEQDELINLIELPFKGTFLEHMVDEGFFFLDPPKLEDLARRASEGGMIFLREMGIEHLLMVPMTYQTEFIGFLALPTPLGSRVPTIGSHLPSGSRMPKDISTVLAICAQAANAIWNARVFEQRGEAYAELERVDKLKDEFLVTASHELRTPLTAISGYSSQLKRQSARATPQTVLRFATKISVAAQQLSDLVANITEAAQIGPAESKMDLHIEPIQVLAAVEFAVNMLTRNSEHTIALDIPLDSWMLGDALSVRQVLTNLLENASKYASPGTQIQVQASRKVLSDVVPLLTHDQTDPTLVIDKGDIPITLIRVIDQGEGILPQDQQRIFDKFVRATRSLTTPVRGSGLGLYICRRFVEAMGGKIWLEQSIANEGSTFSFYLPFVESPVDPSE
jgi:signal transduction histidine kinase